MDASEDAQSAEKPYGKDLIVSFNILSKVTEKLFGILKVCTVHNYVIIREICFSQL